jgi:ETFB lysine methyltransferase
MAALRYLYQTLEFEDLDIHIRSLRDANQFSDDLGEAEGLGISSAQWSLFGVLWSSSEVLAHEMAEYEIEGKRVLEVGCGVGLSSVLLNARGADITATDYHPEAGNFLAVNSELNGGKKIPYLRADWADSANGLGTFDLIIGSDLLYEREHIDLLSAFINRHAKQNCEVVVVDPGRGNHAVFSKKMVTFGYKHSQYQPDCSAYLQKPFKGQILRYQRGESS